MTTVPGRLVLLGHPVEQSLSPTFQNAALRHAGLPLRYQALDVPADRVDETLRGLRATRGAGNVTIPHKRVMFERCDRRTDVAERAGAVNTFWHDDEGRLHGDNTDVPGFADVAAPLLLASRGGVTPPTALRVAVLGAGGAAAATVVAALDRWEGCEIRLWSRSLERARALAARFGGAVGAVLRVEDAVGDAALVVNATPLGMLDDEMPCDPLLIRDGAAVVDLVYRREALSRRRPSTAWSRAARERRTAWVVDGLPMLLAQGAHAFQRWFGVTPDATVMREAVWGSRR